MIVAIRGYVNVLSFHLKTFAHEYSDSQENTIIPNESKYTLRPIKK